MFRRRAPTIEPTPDPWDAVLDVFFPNGLDADQTARVRAAIGGRRPSPTAARAALGTLDQQTVFSPVTIRWSTDDIEFADVGGIKLALDRADASVSIQVSSGAYEPHVAATLDRLLVPGAVFVDVGANIGYHSVRAVAAVGPSGRVVAVEANPENARLLAHTIEANVLDNVTLLPVALSQGWGHVTFGSHVGSNGGFLSYDDSMATSGRGMLVPTVALDDLGLDLVSVVKIDVEGAEGFVVDGCRATIEQHRPAFVMEFSIEMTERVSARSPEEHLQRFVDWGYSIAIIDRRLGQAEPSASVDRLLADWGDHLRIEDLLLLPEERQSELS